MLVADEQTQGRGRLGRRWETPPGSGLAMSCVVEPDALLSLRAGVAAAEACGSEVRLKWPNDLLLQGRKLGGILVENRRGRAVVGIGINVTSAPPGSARLDGEREALLERLLNALDAWLEAPPEMVLERWRQLSATLGARVRVELPDGVVEGVAEDIDSDGALIVDGRRLVAGDVVHLIPHPLRGQGQRGASSSG